MNINEKMLLEIEQDILDKNQKIADANSLYFKEKNIFCLNLMSSPGSGKTTLLEETIRRLKGKIAISVIEGDQQTTNDADRIAALNIPVYQVNTGEGCHLEAEMIREAISNLSPAKDSILFIENVGNLVCPAAYNLGEAVKVVIISTTEGDDKPLKYPYMFQVADICVINKIDLAPYLSTDINTLKNNVLRVNPRLQIFELSAFKGTGMEEWCNYLIT
ncbi:MAG: hydrogenase nickel incorporation protein HypB [Tannerella sp.]|jgi:hydrogenase nickel incorporation protein HypB|nr:hydrogenase nickel incorporation protein HypB [Tannerella sp.]